MSINKLRFLRIAVLAILFSICSIFICPIGPTECYADDKSFTISVSNPQWTYSELQYGTVTVTEAGAQKIKTLSVDTNGGYVSYLPTAPAGASWKTDMSQTINGKTVHQTAICFFGSEGAEAATIQQLIKDMKFILADGSSSMNTTFIADGQDLTLPTVDGYTVTRGSDNHYYVFVPCDETQNVVTDPARTWSNAYDLAKSLKLMGMQGYLATITSKAENLLLDKITTKGAWAGAAMVKKDISITVPGANTVTADWFEKPTPKPDAADDYSDYVWMWVCGPEAGTMINIKGGYANDKYKVYNPDIPGQYTNWNRNDLVDPNPGNEPNFSSQNEHCMSVHYGNTGEAGNGVLAWNDLPNVCMNDWDTYISGYFVEFSGLDISSPLNVVKADTQTYAHTWKYTPDGDNKMKITCTNPSHLHCDYKDGGEDSKDVVVIIKTPDEAYNAAAYDSAAVELYVGSVKTNLTELSYYGISYTESGAAGSQPVVKYSGRGSTTYAESSTAPTSAGTYTARTTIKCGGVDKDITQNFEITKVNLIITLNDQSVLKDAPIDKSYNDIPNGLIKSIEGLAGTGAGADKLDSIKADAIVANTHTGGTININMTVPEAVVLKNSSGTQVVNGNYNISIVPGNLSVAAKNPEKTTNNPTATQITYGQKLSASTITGTGVFVDPVTSAAIAGTFTWTDGDTTIPEVKDSSDKNHTKYRVTFTPDNLEDYTIDYDSITLGLKVVPKDIASADINRTIELNSANEPSVALHDTQTDKDLTLDSDFTVSHTVEGDKVKVTVTAKPGTNANYTNSFTVYLDAHKWTSRVETTVVVDTSANELSPSVSSVSESIGGRILKDVLHNAEGISAADKEKAERIVNSILTNNYSTEGDFKALVSVLMSNADNTVTDPEKNCAASAIGVNVSGQSALVPSGAKIGMYFDVSMKIEYTVNAKPSDAVLVNQTKAIHDTSEAAFPGAGFAETVQITVPERLRPASGYSRTYYIIRVHDDGINPLKWDVLPVTRSGYKLTFSTDKFSKYALAYVETKDPEKKSDSNSSDSGSGSSNQSSSLQSPVPVVAAGNIPAPGNAVQVTAPKTGDTWDVYAAVILSLVGVLWLMILRWDQDKETDAQ